MIGSRGTSSSDTGDDMETGEVWPSHTGSVGVGALISAGAETSGRSRSSIRVIEAKCVPASTAKSEFLVHPAAVERIRSPVTLSSLGPPPEPCETLALVHVGLSSIVLLLGVPLSRHG